MCSSRLPISPALLKKQIVGIIYMSWKGETIGSGDILGFINEKEELEIQDARFFFFLLERVHLMKRERVP